MSNLAQIGNVLPAANLRYPDSIVKKRAELLERYEEEKKNPNLRTKLVLVAETLMMLKDQSVFESANKIRALAYVEKNRMDRKKKALDDSGLDRV